MFGMNFKKIISVILTISLISAVTFACEKAYVLEEKYYLAPNLLEMNRVQIDHNLDENEVEAFQFVRRHMSSQSGGVFTNYLDTQEVKDHATGHEVLSESMGLLMLYAVQENDKDLFDQQFTLTIRALLEPTYLVKWRIKDSDRNLSMSSASIDDLRIARALILAKELWGDEKYSVFLDKISEDMLQLNLSSGQLTNYYNHETEETGTIIDLSYLDLRTMAILSKTDSKWVRPLGHGLTTIKGGYISDTFPLYHRSYDVENEAYIKVNTINIIDSLTTMLHLSEVGELEQNSVDWLYKQLIEVGHIYIQYDVNGKQTSQLESTAAYALVARLAKAVGDQQLYKLAIAKMSLYQIKDKSSVLYGAFGDDQTLQVFSYDNLQALLAY